MELDKFAAANGGNYTVRSIYFDTTNLAFFNEKIEGLKMRKKLRIRGYDKEDESSINFLEIKRRFGTPIYKNRAPILYKNVDQFLHTGDLSLIENLKNFPNARSDASRFMFQLNRYGLKPVVNVVYDREAYVGRFDKSIRVTFDMNLRSQIFPRMADLYKDDPHTYTFAKHFILEIKYFGSVMPIWGRTLVKHLACKQEALSKYCMSIESHKTDTSTERVISRTSNLLDEYNLEIADFVSSGAEEKSKSSILYPILP